jgi:hypothetical protein
MIEQLLPHVSLYIDPQLVAPIIDDELKKCADYVQQQQPYAYTNNQVPVPARQQPINEPLHRKRESKLQQGNDDRTAEINDK